MNAFRSRANGGSRPTLHLPGVPRPVPYWSRLIPPGELPPRAVLIRLVLALGLAIALWVRVSADEDPVVTATYKALTPVVTPPNGYYPVQGAPPVTVQAEGLRSNLADAPAPQAYVDLTNVPPTAHGPILAPVRVRGLPPGVELRRVTPSQVSLKLQKQASKTVKVTVQTFGVPPGYYEVSPPTFSPHTVKITGPSGTVNTIASARVVVNESSYTGDRVLQEYPVIYARNGQPVSRRVVRVEPRTVKVTVHIRLQKYQQSVAVTPNITGTVGVGYRIANVTVLPPLVTVLSNAPVLGTTVLQTAPITVTGWTSSHQVAVPLAVPANLTLQHPVQETVAIDIAPVPGSAVSKAQVLVTGKRPGTTVTLDPPAVTIVYQGPIALLNEAGAPVARLDLHNRQPGVYHLAPTISLPAGLSLVSATPAQVRVLITAPPQPRVIVRPTATASATPTPTARPRASATARPTATTTATPSPSRLGITFRLAGWRPH